MLRSDEFKGECDLQNSFVEQLVPKLSIGI